MGRIAPSRSSSSLTVKQIVVLRGRISGNKLDWLNSLAERKSLLEDHVGVIVIDGSGVIVGVSSENLHLGEVIVASPVVGTIGNDDSAGVKNAVSGGDDVF